MFDAKLCNGVLCLCCACAVPVPVLCCAALCSFGQMNEYRVMMFSLGFLMLAVVGYDATARGLSSRHTLTRRLALASNTICSALLFWPVIVTPLWKYFRKDAAYAETFTLGLAPAVASAMLRCDDEVPLYPCLTNNGGCLFTELCDRNV